MERQEDDIEVLSYEDAYRAARESLTKKARRFGWWTASQKGWQELSYEALSPAAQTYSKMAVGVEPGSAKSSPSTSVHFNSTYPHIPISLHPKASNFGTGLSSGTSSQHQRNLRAVQDANLSAFPCLSSPSSASLDGGSPDPNFAKFNLAGVAPGAASSQLLNELATQLEHLETTGAIRSYEDALAAVHDVVVRKMRKEAAKSQSQPNPISMGSGIDIPVTDVRSVGSDAEIGIETDMSDFEIEDPKVDATVKSLGLAQTIGGISRSAAKRQKSQKFEADGEIVFGIDYSIENGLGSGLSFHPGSGSFEDPNLNRTNQVQPLIRMPLDIISHHVGIILVNSETGNILLWNEMMEEFTGVPAIAAVGNVISAFLPLADDQEYIQSCVEAVAENTEHQCKPHVFTFMKADGLNKAHLSMTLVSGRTRGVVMGVGIHRPRSTDRLFSKWVLEQVTPRLETVLNSVGGYQQPDSPPIPTDFKDMLGPGIEYTMLSTPFTPAPSFAPPQIHSVISDTLGFIERAAKVDTAGWGPLNIVTTFKKLVVDYQEKNINISLTFGESTPEEAHTDMTRFPKAIAFLVTNAVQNSRAGGQVDVSVQLENGCESGMGSISVEVLTDGQEIPQEIIQAIKDRNCDVAGELIEVSDALEDLGGSLTFEKRQTLHTQRRSISWSLKSQTANTATVVKEGSTLGGLASVKSLTHLRDASCFVTCAVVSIPYIRSEQQEFSESLKATLNETMFSQRLASTEHVAQNTADMTSEEVKLARKEIIELQADPLVKCVVVEGNVVYKMTFCHHLWERSFALTLAASMNEVLSQISSVDLVLIDVDGDVLDVEELLGCLLESHSNVEVMVASRLITPQLKAKIAETNWVGITLPVDCIEFQKALDEVELRVLKRKIQKQNINEMRSIFGSGNVPWERGKLLGTGSFGKVYEAIMQLTGGKMAVKCIPLVEGMDEDMLLGEVKLMSEFIHPNIIHYFYSEITETELLIFMEYASEGSLSSRIQDGGCPEAEASKYMEDITKGLAYLHSKGVAHRDMKVANVLFSRGVCKLTDFGTATKVQKNNTTSGGETVGTLAFMAPEVTEGAPADPAADIWSLGCLLMELCTNKTPFIHKGTGFLVVKYVTSLKSSDRVDYGPYAYGHRTIRFLNETLVVDPERRATCDELLKSDLVMGTEVMVRKATVFGLTREARQQSMANVHASFRRRPGQTPGRTPATFSFRASPGGGRSRTCPGHVLAAEAAAALDTDSPPVSLTEKALREASAQAALHKQGTFKLGGNIGSGGGGTVGFADAPVAARRVSSDAERAENNGAPHAIAVCSASEDSDFSGWGDTNDDKHRQEEEEKARRMADRAVTDVLRQSFVTGNIGHFSRK